MTNVSGGLGVRYTLYYPSFGVFKHVRWGAPMALCRARNNCTRHTKALQLQLSDGTGFMSKLPAEVGAPPGTAIALLVQEGRHGLAVLSAVGSARE